MNGFDWFVGGLAVVLGVLCLLGGIFQIAWYYQLPKVQRIEQRWGQPAARAMYILLGVGLISLGFAIARGWRLFGG